MDGETFEALHFELAAWFHDDGHGLSTAEARIAAREVLDLLEIVGQE